MFCSLPSYINLNLLWSWWGSRYNCIDNVCWVYRYYYKNVFSDSSGHWLSCRMESFLLCPSSSICRNFLNVLTPGSNSLYRVVHFNGGVTWYKWSLIGEGGTVETRWLYMVWRGYHSYSQQQTGVASLICEWVGLLQVMRLGFSMGKRKCNHMYQDIFASQVSNLHTLTYTH